MVATLKLEGAKELQRKLKRLESKAVRRVNTKAVREGLKPVASEAKRTAPVGETKQLRKSIGRKTKGFRSGNAIGIVGTRKQQPAPHYHLVELGHRLVRGGTVARQSGKTTGLDKRGNRGTGRVIGFVKGRHFMKKALTTKAASALANYTREMRSGIISEAKKP